MSKDVDELFDDEITTGATLASGTTVGGNQVYHLGNDGSGSGLDAETVGGEMPVTKGVEIEEEKLFISDTSEFTGTTMDPFFVTPGQVFDVVNHQGLGVDSNDNIWVSDGHITGPEGTSSITKWNISKLKQNLDENPVPEETYTLSSFPDSLFATGVTADENDCIWCAGQLSTGDSIGRFDQNINDTGLKFNTPFKEFSIQGIGIDSSGCIWAASDAFEGNASIYKIDTSGTIYKQFSTGTTQGLEIDGNDSIWYYDNGNNMLKKIDQQGNKLAEFSPAGLSGPTDGIQGVGIDSKECMWVLAPATFPRFTQYDVGMEIKHKLTQL